MEEKKFLHKALDAKKEIVTFSNRLDKARFVLVMSRFTFVSGKIKNLKMRDKPLEFNTPLEYVKKLPEGLDFSAYCKDESEIYQKIKLFESDCRLCGLYDRMKSLGWFWEGDDWDEILTVTDGKHDNLFDTAMKHLQRGYELSEEGAFHTNIRLKSRK